MVSQAAMIIQGCLNGARPSNYHPSLPCTADAMAKDAIACRAAGADELHIHPRRADGVESLAAADETLAVVRRACPGMLVGVSTGDWIEGSRDRTLAAITGWRTPPDYASCNLVEPDAPDVMSTLLARGFGIEAGIASVADAERLVHLPIAQQVFRILVEPAEQDLDAARATAAAIVTVVSRVLPQKPLLLHGVDTTGWPLIDDARRRGWSTRVGFEDGLTMPDGTVASQNAMLVTAAYQIASRAGSHPGQCMHR